LAGRVKLFEHADFATILVATGEHFGMAPQIAEKDYYVTEALRLAHEHLGERVIFKGGTSLSKGWKLIARFSEDIDLFVDPSRFDPKLETKNRVDKALKGLRNAIATHPALDYLTGEGRTTGGRGRQDFFAYRSRFGDLPGIRPVVMAEPGIRSGDHPTQEVLLQSYASEYLAGQRITEIADDLEPFPMQLMHFRRTYVEKLFTLHSHVARMLETGGNLGRSARHYADVHLLAQTEEVKVMLASPEFSALKADCDKTSRAFFGASYSAPAGLSFAESPALFPDEELKERLRQAYDRDCAVLFFGPFPSLDEVLAGFKLVRNLL
jgi:hypothetical protein